MVHRRIDKILRQSLAEWVEGLLVALKRDLFRRLELMEVRTWPGLLKLLRHELRRRKVLKLISCLKTHWLHLTELIHWHIVEERLLISVKLLVIVGSSELGVLKRELKLVDLHILGLV